MKRNHLPKRRVTSNYEVRYDAETGERITSSRKRPHKGKPVASNQQEHCKQYIHYNSNVCNVFDGQIFFKFKCD